MPPPNVPRPCAVVRVSTDDQDLSQQLTEIRRWCMATLGVELADADIYREQGVSGWKNKTLDSRPGLHAAVTGCLTGRYTHLVVHKVDRGGRNVALMAGVIDQLKQAKVIFVSVMEGLDTSQLGAEFVINLLLAFAQHFGSNHSVEIRKGNRRRREAGLHHGRWPYGAMPDPQTGALIPDLRPLEVVTSSGHATETTRYAGLLLLLEQVAADRPYWQVGDTLHAAGYRTDGRRGVDRWEPRAISHLVRNRSYLGEVSDGAGGWLPGAHAPLVPLDLWQRVEASVLRRQWQPRTERRDKHIYALSGGVLRCATCAAAGRSVALHVKEVPRTAHQFPAFVCYARMQRRGCTEPTVPGGALIEQIGAILDAVHLDPLIRDQAIAAWVATQGGPGPDVIQQRRALDERRRRLGRAYADGLYTDADYAAERDKIQRQAHHLLTQAQGVGSTADELRAIADHLATLGATWRAMNEEERQGVVRLLFSEVYVAGKQIVAYRPTAAYWPVFAGIVGHQTIEQRMAVYSHSDLSGLPDDALIPDALPAVRRYYGARPAVGARR